MKVAGLFSGIGGLELPFKARGIPSVLLCEVWEPAQKVLASQFPNTPIHADITQLRRLPSDAALVTAGFPCTDLSQAGQTAGIRGEESGLVSHVFRLLKNVDIEWLVLENVRNMLVLEKGRAMRVLTSQLEELGFSWAYRLVDSQFTGVPQRRHRVLMVASRKHDPRTVLFADDAGEPRTSQREQRAFGFYWTEGLRGLGWAPGGVPPLKGGSTVGIPSPPAIWIPNNSPGHRIVTPSIEVAEYLQGFNRGWTQAAAASQKNGPRWKLVGNAVTVGVADWLASRLVDPSEPVVPSVETSRAGPWPTAAYGRKGLTQHFHASLWPIRRRRTTIDQVLSDGDAQPLSSRATAGFLSRLKRSSLKYPPEFAADLEKHIATWTRRTVA